MLNLTRLFWLAPLLVACSVSNNPESGSTTEGGSESGTFGKGETSVSESDPTVPPTPTTTDGDVSGTTISPEPGTSTTTFPATDSMPGTDSNPGTISETNPTTVSGSTTVDDDPLETTGSPVCNDRLDQPQDSPCNDPSGCGCASGRCFLIPILGGFCGECLEDADCAPGGCTIPDPVNVTGSVCNKGEPGAGCQSDAVCADPNHADCGEVIDIPGILTVATCGECKVNADCTQAEPNCSPVYDLEEFAGAFECVANGSVANNGGCSLTEEGGEPIGNAACASGICGEATLMGLVKFGICGECNSDADCGGGETCTDPVVDLDESVLIGSVCQ